MVRRRHQQGDGRRQPGGVRLGAANHQDQRAAGGLRGGLHDPVGGRDDQESAVGRAAAADAGHGSRHGPTDDVDASRSRRRFSYYMLNVCSDECVEHTFISTFRLQCALSMWRNVKQSGRRRCTHTHTHTKYITTSVFVHRTQSPKLHTHTRPFI